MAKKWIKGAIKHPGIEKRKAARNGISTHEQLVRDSQSSDSTTRARGTLGLTLSGMSKSRHRA
jgi:hypothetical protein